MVGQVTLCGAFLLMKVGLLKTTLVNYPAHTAAAVFLPGCNLRCPYCHNGGLALGKEEGLIEWEEALEHLKKRRGVLDGVVFSGGEPLLHDELGDMIRDARKLGYLVKLDTNGTLFGRLESLVRNKDTCPDMVSMDIKTQPAKYFLLGGGDYEDAVRKSAQFLVIEKACGNLDVEFRTVLAPGIVEEVDIREIATELLPEQADWKFADFVPGSCLDPSWNDRLPFGEKEKEALLAAAGRELGSSK